MRKRDWVAFQLGGKNELPPFQLYWPLNQRNDAIDKLVKILKGG